MARVGRLVFNDKFLFKFNDAIFAIDLARDSFSCFSFDSFSTLITTVNCKKLLMLAETACLPTLFDRLLSSKHLLFTNQGIYFFRLLQGGSFRMS